MDYRAIGNRIRQRRKELLRTQESLANQIEISYSYMGLIERGDRKLSVETLHKISKALDTSMDYLVNGKPEEPSTGSILLDILDSMSPAPDIMPANLPPERREVLQRLFKVIAERMDEWYK